MGYAEGRRAFVVELSRCRAIRAGSNQSVESEAFFLVRLQKSFNAAVLPVRGFRVFTQLQPVFLWCSCPKALSTTGCLAAQKSLEAILAHLAAAFGGQLSLAGTVAPGGVLREWETAITRMAENDTHFV